MSNQVNKAGVLGDVGHVVVLVQRVQVDAVHTAGAILVDQLDGVVQTGLAEVGLLLLGIRVKGGGIIGIGEDPVLGDDLAQLAVHHAGIAAQGIGDGSGVSRGLSQAGAMGLIVAKDINKDIIK